jgi:hypothetical protein
MAPVTILEESFEGTGLEFAGFVLRTNMVPHLKGEM